jgi:hypothetical protein
MVIETRQSRKMAMPRCSLSRYASRHSGRRKPSHCNGSSGLMLRSSDKGATAGSGNSGPLCITPNLFALASVDTLQGCTPGDSMASTPKKDKQLTIKFHSSELAQLRESAKQRQQPVSVMVRQALRAAGVPIAA